MLVKGASGHTILQLLNSDLIIQCLRNCIGTSAFADVSYLMADAGAMLVDKNVLNTSQNAAIGRC